MFIKSTTTVEGARRRFDPGAGMVFALLWLIVFCLYFPAAKAGFVADFTGWLDQVRNHSFAENINRTNYKVQSMYQFTQLATWCFYKLFGTSVWLWHLLFVTLHTVNAFLLYTLVKRLLEPFAERNAKLLSFTGAALFCISPYCSEVVVWEPSFHYLPGLLFILLQLLWVQRYAHTGQRKYAVFAGIIYLVSTFALEIFYIVPWLVLSFALYYRQQDAYGKPVFRGILKYFFLPAILLFIAHLVEYRLFYGTWVAHISADNQVSISLTSFGKPIKYLFHLLFLGRFFPHNVKQSIYGYCDSMVGISTFYFLVITSHAYMVYRFRRFEGKAKMASLLGVWALITLLLLVPLWFQDLLLVLQDRYLYFTAAIFYMWFVVLVSLIPRSSVSAVIIGLFALANLRYAIQVSRYWGKSEKVIAGLLNGIPGTSRTMLLLNLPQSMHGVAMIGAEKESEFKLMHDQLMPGKAIHTKVYDVQAYNMETPTDGAHVTVLTDSTAKVTLNQWGTWWWYETKGGHGYDNEDYNLNLTDPGHEYIITLKKPADKYLLLYQVGDQWKMVDLSKKGVEQN